MTNKQMERELSREYLEWQNDPADHDYVAPVEEIERLCRVIVRLRAKLNKMQSRRSDAEAERRGAMKAVEWLEIHDYLGLADDMREAIERGEVVPVKAEPLIVSRPGVMGGKPCVRGTRITVETLQGAGFVLPFQAILENYPGLTSEGLAAALAYKLPGKAKGAKRA